MKHLTYQVFSALLGFALVSTFTACEATGDPNQDTIFFDRRLGDQRLQRKQQALQQLNAGNSEIAARRRHLQSEIATAHTTESDVAAEIRHTRADRAAAEQELARTRAELETAQAGSRELQQLRARLEALRAEVNRLDVLLADLLQTKSHHYQQ